MFGERLISGYGNSGVRGLGAFELPIIISYNWGAVSTLRSIDFKGGALCLGISFHKYPLFTINKNTTGIDGFQNLAMLYTFSIKRRKWVYYDNSEGFAKEKEYFFAYEKLNQNANFYDGFSIGMLRMGIIYRRFLNY